MTYNETKNDGNKLSKDNAVWQYILDHSMPTPVGLLVRFHVKDKVHWNGKVEARMNGLYRSVEKEEEEKMRKLVDGYFYQKKINDRMGAQVNEIDRRGTLFEKLALFTYRKCRDIIQKKKISKDFEK